MLDARLSVDSPAQLQYEYLLKPEILTINHTLVPTTENHPAFTGLFCNDMTPVSTLVADQSYSVHVLASGAIVPVEVLFPGIDHTKVKGTTLLQFTNTISPISGCTIPQMEDENFSIVAISDTTIYALTQTPVLVITASEEYQADVKTCLGFYLNFVAAGQDEGELLCLKNDLMRPQLFGSITIFQDNEDVYSMCVASLVLRFMTNQSGSFPEPRYHPGSLFTYLASRYPSQVALMGRYKFSTVGTGLLAYWAMQAYTSTTPVPLSYFTKYYQRMKAHCDNLEAVCPSLKPARDEAEHTLNQPNQSTADWAPLKQTSLKALVMLPPTLTRVQTLMHIAVDQPTILTWAKAAGTAKALRTPGPAVVAVILESLRFGGVKWVSWCSDFFTRAKSDALKKAWPELYKEGVKFLEKLAEFDSSTTDLTFISAGAYKNHGVIAANFKRLYGCFDLSVKLSPGAWNNMATTPEHVFRPNPGQEAKHDKLVRRLLALYDPVGLTLHEEMDPDALDALGIPVFPNEEVFVEDPADVIGEFEDPAEEIKLPEPSPPPTARPTAPAPPAEEFRSPGEVAKETLATPHLAWSNPALGTEGEWSYVRSRSMPTHISCAFTFWRTKNPKVTQTAHLKSVAHIWTKLQTDQTYRSRLCNGLTACLGKTAKEAEDTIYKTISAAGFDPEFRLQMDFPDELQMVVAAEDPDTKVGFKVYRANMKA
eukprot:Blabericola_migrator_1__3033@NODE_1882_length_3608_cov_169_778029_g1205_i0_p1_GENE_NODE_1882_length_3608_cov_169_778029_g1205_i0NODE_1882_length_3608_cov_169_778029_g1205_i0_p1_ORF_typecomplete_len709_score107_62_NODE_1882_length_3608_cov_169_778029_g1205_i011653291